MVTSLTATIINRILLCNIILFIMFLQMTVPTVIVTHTPCVLILLDVSEEKLT